MSLEPRPVSRAAKYGPEWDADDPRDHPWWLSRPAGGGSGPARGGTDGEQSLGADEAPDERREVIRRLPVGVASQVCRPEALPRRGRMLGGDFADVVALSGGRVALVLGDVCGKGAAAARCVPQTLYALRLILSEHPHPARALGRLNRYLCGSGMAASCPSVALSLAVVDTGTGDAACACAGSQPPLILRAGGEAEAGNASIAALGVDPWRTYRAVDFLLGTGDALLLATDGIAEARRVNGAGSGDLLCYEGLAGLALDAFGAGGTPGQVARAVLEGARAFAGGALHDDACVLVATRR